MAAFGSSRVGALTLALDVIHSESLLFEGVREIGVDTDDVQIFAIWLPNASSGLY